jgi:hypothetical protein
MSKAIEDSETAKTLNKQPSESGDAVKSAGVPETAALARACGDDDDDDFDIEQLRGIAILRGITLEQTRNELRLEEMVYTAYQAVDTIIKESRKQRSTSSFGSVSPNLGSRRGPLASSLCLRVISFARQQIIIHNNLYPGTSSPSWGPVLARYRF